MADLVAVEAVPVAKLDVAAVLLSPSVADELDTDAYHKAIITRARGGGVENELTILIVVISGEVRGRGRGYIEERIDVVHVPARGKDSCSIK